MVGVTSDCFTHCRERARGAPDLKSGSPFLLRAAGTRGGGGDAAVGRTRKKRGPRRWSGVLPGCPSLRVCWYTCAVAVLFYITNCLGSARWGQRRASREPGPEGRGGDWVKCEPLRAGEPPRFYPEVSSVSKEDADTWCV